jgi:hypothetical protein
MKTILTLVLALLCGQAFAGFMIDPFVGYDMGGIKATTTGGGAVDLKATGMSYGTRLGFRSMDGLSIAAEYTGGSGKLKDDSGAAVPLADEDYSHTATGIVLGYDRSMYRAWVGYGISDQLTEKGTSSDTVYKGTNYKIGLGVMPIRHLSINFEYIVPKYTKVTVGSGAETDVSSSFSKFDTSVMSVSLSSPFDFGGK